MKKQQPLTLEPLIFAILQLKEAREKEEEAQKNSVFRDQKIS